MNASKRRSFEDLHQGGFREWCMKIREQKLLTLKSLVMFQSELLILAETGQEAMIILRSSDR